MTAVKNTANFNLPVSDDESDAKDDETLSQPDEDKDGEEEILADELLVKKKVRVGKNFSDEFLIANDGLQRIYEEFPRYIEFKRGNEAYDIKRLTTLYKEWAYQLYPGLAFEDLLKSVHSYGSRSSVKNKMESLRGRERNRYMREVLKVEPLNDAFDDYKRDQSPVVSPASSPLGKRLSSKSNSSSSTQVQSSQAAKDAKENIISSNTAGAAVISIDDDDFDAACGILLDEIEQSLSSKNEKIQVMEGKLGVDLETGKSKRTRLSAGKNQDSSTSSRYVDINDTLNIYDSDDEWDDGDGSSNSSSLKKSARTVVLDDDDDDDDNSKNNNNNNNNNNNSEPISPEVDALNEKNTNNSAHPSSADSDYANIELDSGDNDEGAIEEMTFEQGGLNSGFDGELDTLRDSTPEESLYEQLNNADDTGAAMCMQEKLNNDRRESDNSFNVSSPSPIAQRPIEQEGNEIRTDDDGQISDYLADDHTYTKSRESNDGESQASSQIDLETESYSFSDSISDWPIPDTPCQSQASFSDMPATQDY